MATIETNILAGVLHGKAGSAAFSRRNGGIVLRPRTLPRNPRTHAQTAVRNHIAKAVIAYRALTPVQAAAWKAYAQTQFRIDARDGTARNPTAYAAFVGLAAKFLQINPSGAIPVNPPAFGFVGDLITVTAAGGTGQITFTPSAFNSVNVKTEVLLQPLRFGHQSPNPRGYRTQSFAAFTLGTPTVTLSVAPGWYAPAYRFVHVLTGQETQMKLLGVVQVG